MSEKFTFNTPFGPRSGYFKCCNEGCDNKAYHTGTWDEKRRGVECVACFGKRIAKKLIEAEEKKNVTKPYAIQSGYCVRCKKAVIILDPRKVTMKNGRPAVRGGCGTCKSTVYRILPSDVREPDTKEKTNG